MLAPGFRFHPTDEELIWYYLRRKVTGQSLRFNAISETDIYKFEPWDLPDKSSLKTRDLEWYFFSALDKKYGNSIRMNRSTNKGYWKTTGKDRLVRHESQLVGMKKTLVFHNGRAPDGERTNWIMHEYRLADEKSEKSGDSKDVFVLCRVFQKSGLGPPTGDRYAPFIEDEWDDNSKVFIPGGNEVVSDDACVEGVNLEGNITQSMEMETSDHNCLPMLSLASPETFPLVPKKRLSKDDLEPLHLTASEFTNISTQDGSSSTTAATTNQMMMTKNVPLEFQLFKSLECQDMPRINTPTFTSANISTFLPSAYAKMFIDMRSEIHNVSSEKAMFKIELMSAQAMINVLQARVDSLIKENADLKASPYE